MLRGTPLYGRLFPCPTKFSMRTAPSATGLLPRIRPKSWNRYRHPRSVRPPYTRLLATPESTRALMTRCGFSLAAFRAEHGRSSNCRAVHRFFGAAYRDYDFERVEHIAEPVLVAGRRRWTDRPLTWHGDNAMERINLPSQAMGGFQYENSLILFRRIAANTFELRVYPWNSDSARAYVEASRAARRVFRVGRNSNRIAGFIA